MLYREYLCLNMLNVIVLIVYALVYLCFGVRTEYIDLDHYSTIDNLPYNIFYTKGSVLNLAIYLKDVPRDVTTAYLAYYVEGSLKKESMMPGNYCKLTESLAKDNITIDVTLYKSSLWCRLTISTGIAVNSLDQTSPEYNHSLACIKPHNCMVMVYLNKYLNKCSNRNIVSKQGDTIHPNNTESGIENGGKTININETLNVDEGDLTNTNASIDHGSPESKPFLQNNMYKWVFIGASTLAVIIIIFVIIMCVIKHIRRHSASSDVTVENTNITTEQVLYADLDLARSNDIPPRPREETPYAEIIHLKKPNDKHRLCK